MRKAKYTVCVIMAVILVLTGCTGNNELSDISDNETNKYDNEKELETEDVAIDTNQTYNYAFSIYDDHRTFSAAQIEQQASFEAYLNKIFVEEMSDNTVSLHFCIENPSDYGIDEFDATWGNPDYTEYFETGDELQNLLDELETFDYDSLTYEQQLIYDIFRNYLEENISVSDCCLFSSAFAPMSGLQGELPIIFSEYEFLDESDLDDFIVLLNSSYDYIEAMCDYEKYRLQQGYSLSVHSIDQVIEQCKEFISDEPNCLIPVFEESLNNLSFITSEEKSAYLSEFEQGINNSLLPGYRLIIDTLTEIRACDASLMGLCNYENGDKYYEYLVRTNTGSAKSVEELFELCQNMLSEYQTKFSLLYMVNPDIFERMDAFEYPTDNPEEMMNLLLKALQNDFPPAVSDVFSVNYVPESLESSMNPAFYLVPPIDNYNRNIIYINRSDEYASMDLFPTVAHEGFPGHMYQTNFFYSNNPHYFRALFSFNGYSEGWAHYIENEYSYKYAGMDETLANAFKYNSEFSFAIYSYADMGIHYYGWTLDEAAENLSPYINNRDIVEEIYYTLVDEPAIYLRYYIGSLEILDLREEAEEKLGAGFDIVEFHKFLLEIGPCYFDIIENRMQNWMQRVME